MVFASSQLPKKCQEQNRVMQVLDDFCRICKTIIPKWTQEGVEVKLFKQRTCSKPYNKGKKAFQSILSLQDYRRHTGDPCLTAQNKKRAIAHWHQTILKIARVEKQLELRK
ncbi:uncharacterized protein ACOB8E_019536 isoform 1-T1 [Sarcophilus harrisii]